MSHYIESCYISHFLLSNHSSLWPYQLIAEHWEDSRRGTTNFEGCDQLIKGRFFVMTKRKTVKEKVCQPMRMLSHWALFVSTNQMTLSSELWSKLSVIKCRKWICCTVYSASHLYWDNPCSFRQSSSTAAPVSSQTWDCTHHTTTTDHVRQI